MGGPLTSVPVGNVVIKNSTRFDQYDAFAQEQIRNGNKTAIVRTTENGGVSKCEDGDFVGRVLRGDQRERLNNDTRDDFLQSVLERCGKKTVNDLPPEVQKALELGKFALDRNGKSSSGKPLTARRIRDVRQAIRDYELKGPKDPLSDVPILQTSGTGLCYANSFINALKTSDAGRKYLKSIFNPKGCTLFKRESPSSKVFIPTKYTYSKVNNPEYRRFTKLEQAMLMQKKLQEPENSRYDQRGGTPSLGAEMLGMTSKTFKFAEPNLGGGEYVKNSKLCQLIDDKLKEGKLVVARYKNQRHFVAITGVKQEEDPQEKGSYIYYLQYTDDSLLEHDTQVYWQEIGRGPDSTSSFANYHFATIPEPIQT